MRDRELDTMLRRVHAPAAGDDPRRDRLRAELVAAHRRRHPRKQRWNIMTHKTWFRPVVAGLALLVLGVAACTTPTEYDVQMGQQVTLGLDGADKAASEAMIQEVAAWLEGRDGVEGIMVGIEEIAGGPLTANMTVWGQGLDGAALQADLAVAFPALAEADVTVEALAGTVDGHLADAMGHALFGIEVSGETAEEVRLEILAQLAAEGFSGDARVEVIDEGGERRINIELNDVQAADDAAAGGEGERVIEVKKAR